MPAELQSRVEGAYPSEWFLKESLRNEGRTGRGTEDKPTPARRDAPRANSPSLPPGFTLLPTITFPNGAILLIHAAKAGDSEADDQVAAAYWSVVEAEVAAARRDMLWLAALAWLIPCVAIYSLGWAVAWIRRGFRADPRNAA